jgi:hypothetical protein
VESLARLDQTYLFFFNNYECHEKGKMQGRFKGMALMDLTQLQD